MKVSYSWLKEYIDLPETPEEISKTLTDTGLEVEGIEKFEEVQGGLKGLVIGEVISCEKHPNADRLSVTTVDVGSSELYPIVCGAPNVIKGQKVIVAIPGTILYPTNGEAFKIKKSKIRGEISEGMICAEDEIGLGTEHNGIIVLENNVKNGTLVSAYYELKEDWTIEIGLTPNRGDAASHIGVARDIRAAKNREIHWPDIESFQVDDSVLKIDVSVENEVACPRYSGICISKITVSDSPKWLQNRLKSIGLTPINNIVDSTNFVLHELGQPMHAFDYDKIGGGKVIVKTLPEGSQFTTLDEKERKLSANDLMICDENQGMCIAGVFGGINSGVTKDTKNIFLEVAYFSPSYVRKTAMYHGLKTDASFHYERGTDPNLTVYAVKRAAMLIKEVSGGNISSEIIDIYPSKIKDFEIPVKWSHIDRLIGKTLERDEITGILNNLDINLVNKDETGFTAVVPPYRSDVQREADVIEEILRIHGFNNVELPLTLGASYLAEYPLNDPHPWQTKISHILAGKGWNEILTNSLTKEDYLDYDSSINKQQTVHILNKLSEDLGVLKQTMLFTGLESVAHNLNRKQENIRFFEFGRTYAKNETYDEEQHCILILSGNSLVDDWRKIGHKTSFYDISSTASSVMSVLGVPMNLVEKKLNTDAPFSQALKFVHDGHVLAKVGEVLPSILKKFEIKSKIFYADLAWDLLLNYTNHNIVFEEISKFPPVKRDLSLVVDKSILFSEIESIAKDVEPKLLNRLQVFDVYEGERIEQGKKAYAISFILQDPGKTLTEKIIDKTMNKLMRAFEEKTGALIRQ